MLMWIVESTVVAGLLAGIACLFSRRFRHMPALLHLAWLVVMLRLVMPPLPFELPMSQAFQRLVHPSLERVIPPKKTPDHRQFIGTEPQNQASLSPERVPASPLVQTSENQEASLDPLPKMEEALLASRPSEHVVNYPKLGLNQGEIVEQPAPQDAAFTLVPTLRGNPEEVAQSTQTLKIGTWKQWPWSTIFLTLWVMGSLLTIGINTYRMMVMRRRLSRAAFGEISLINQVTVHAKRMGVKPPAVVMLEQIATPFVWCLGKPTLVWPSQLTPWRDDHGQTEMLTHELAHIKRRDHWFIWVELLVGALLWWHPLFWIARSKSRFYAELACDATVIHQTPHLRESYARALINAMAHLPLSRPTVGTLALGPSKKKAFETRLAAIMNKKTTLKKPVWALAILITAGFLALPAFKPRPLATPQILGSQDLAEDLDFLTKDAKDKVKARAAYQMAKRYMHAKDWTTAESLLHDALQINPDDAHIWYKYGEVLLELGKYQEAIRAFEENRSQEVYSHSDLLIAKALVKGKRYEDAMVLLESLGRRGKLDTDCLGDTAFDALFDDPSYAQLTLRSAQYQKQAEQARRAMHDEAYREAATLFQGLTKIAPESSWVWDRLCYVLVPLKEYDQAEAALAKAMALAPETPHLVYNQACIAALRGKTSQALPLLKKALGMGFHNLELLRKDPDIDALRNKPAFKTLLAELEDERTTGKKIEDLYDRKNYTALLGLLDSAAQMKTLDKKDHAYINRMRGLANLGLERYEEAEAAFIQQVNLAKPHKMKNPLYNLACALAGQGRTQAALASLKASILLGYKNLSHMEKDQDLALLYDEPAFLELIQQAGREKLMRRYDHVDWPTFEAWIDQQLSEKTLTRKEMNKLATRLYHGKAWFQAGKAYAALSELDPDDAVPYNAACSYALAGETELAFQWLDKAVAAGFHNKSHMRRDSDLNSLKKDPRWEAIQKSL